VTEPTSLQPNQTPAAPPASPAVDADAIRKQVVDELFAGKYQGNFDAAKQGVWNLMNSSAEAYKLLQEYRDNGVQVQQGPPQKDALTRLHEEAYIPVDAFREAVSGIVAEEVRQAFAPLTGAMDARNTLATEAPEYLQNESTILSWLATQPQAGAEIKALNDAGLYKQAAKYALLQWKLAKPVTAPGDPALRANAALPNQQITQPTGSQSQDPTLMEQAIRYHRVSGDSRPAYQMLFPDFEPQLPPHLQPRP